MVRELLAAGELAGGLDGVLAVLVPVGAHAVEMFEGEPDGVHAGMAARAHGVFPVLLHALAQGALQGLAGLQRRDVRRRRRRRGGQQVFQHPLAPLHRGGAVGVGGDGEDAALREQALPLRAGERDLAELLAGDPGQAVVLGQPLIDEGVIGGEEVDDRPVLLEDVPEELLRLRAHVAAQLLAEVGEFVVVGIDDGQHPQLQPLAGEILRQRLGLGIAEHAPDLGVQIPAEFAGVGEREELRVGHGTPEEVGEPRGEGVFVDVADGRGVVRVRLQLVAEQEVGRNQRSGERVLDPGREVVAVRPGLVIQLHEAVRLGGGDRPAPGLAGEVGDQFAGDRALVLAVGLLGEDAPVRLGQGHLGAERAGHLDVVAVEVAVLDDLLLLGRFALARGLHGLDVVEVVEEGDGHLLLAGRLDLHLGLIGLGFADLGLHVELLDVLAVQPHGHLHRVRTGLLAVGLHAQHIFAGGRKLVGHGELAVGGQAAHLADIGTALKLLGREMPGRGRTRAADDGLVHDALGGAKVLLEEHRRQREHVADVVKAVADVVLWEVIRRLEVHAHEIAHRVVVFDAVQPVQGHAARVRVVGVHREEGLPDPGGDGFTLVQGRLGLLLLGRHVAGLDVVQHVFPRLPVLEHRSHVGEGIQRKVPLGGTVAVAVPAVLVEQGQDFLLEMRVRLGQVHLGRPQPGSPWAGAGTAKGKPRRSDDSGDQDRQDDDLPTHAYQIDARVRPGMRKISTQTDAGCPSQRELRPAEAAENS